MSSQTQSCSVRPHRPRPLTGRKRA